MKKQNNITVNFKRLSKKAVIPSYAHPTDAGMDLVAVSKSETERYIEYGLGFSTSIPEGWAGFIFPNSRISKYDLVLANSVPIIDCHYTGEWKLRFKKSLWSTFKFTIAKMKNWFGIKDFDLGWEAECKSFNVGDVVGQLVLFPITKVDFIEVDALPETDRGDGGFGSTANVSEAEVATTIEPVPITEEPKKKPRKRKKKE